VARQFTDLTAWQLARELKLRVYEFVREPAVARDWDFVRQIHRRRRIGPTEHRGGFWSFQPTGVCQLLKIAIASEQEVRNHFIDAFDRGYLPAARRDENINLAHRAIAAATRLRAYLLSDRNPYD
jgi:hypothetical protein